MFDRGAFVDNIPKITIIFENKTKIATNDAIEWLKKIRLEIDKESPLYYNEIVINERISLWIPGKYDKKYPGDYLLTWDKKPPRHEDVCGALVRLFDDGGDAFERYENLVCLLEDVYYNGTLNIDKSANEKECFIRELVFWITLQEDINRYEKLGRLTPFCRYIEAVSTKLPGSEHSYEDVLKRLDATNPEILNPWDLPVAPKYYKWSAF